MRDSTIARNYAETLLVLAGRAEDLRGWGKILTEVSSAVEQNPTLRLFLESPKVSGAQKSEVIGKAFSDRMPRLMLRFLQTRKTTWTSPSAWRCLTRRHLSISPT